MAINEFKKDGSKYISEKIAEAIKNGSRTATITGFWDIDEPVRLPSDICIVLENCHLRVATGAFTNIFVNEKFNTELGRTPDGKDRNITIKGKGFAILDGNEEYNGLSERTQKKNGFPEVYKNNLIIFTNVDGFSVSDIECRNQGWWAMNFYYSSNGYVGNVKFQANDTRIDENGKRHKGLIFEDYESTLVKNADGINLRVGCHDVVIENITGFTEDDTIALTAVPDEYFEKEFGNDEMPLDIFNVTVRNVRASSYCSIVRILNQGGPKIHDVLLENLYDTSDECPSLNHGCNVIKIGDLHPYAERHATEDENYNITVRNIYACGVNALKLTGGIGNLSLQGIECKAGTKMFQDDRGKPLGQKLNKKLG